MKTRKTTFQRLIAKEREQNRMYKYDLNGNVRKHYKGIHGMRFLAKRGFSENFRKCRVGEGMKKIMEWLYG